MLALAALHNFIRHRVNGEENSFYKDADWLREEGFESGLLEPYGDTIQGRNGPGQTVDYPENVVERDAISEKMWLQYVQVLRNRQ